MFLPVSVYITHWIQRACEILKQMILTLKPVSPGVVSGLSLHLYFRLIRIGSSLPHGRSLNVPVCWRHVDVVIRLKIFTNNLPVSCVAFVVYRMFNFMRLRYEIWRFPKQWTFNFWIFGLWYILLPKVITIFRENMVPPSSMRSIPSVYIVHWFICSSCNDCVSNWIYCVMIWMLENNELYWVCKDVVVA
jgi:hypothetical protein